MKEKPFSYLSSLSSRTMLAQRTLGRVALSSVRLTAASSIRSFAPVVKMFFFFFFVVVVRFVLSRIIRLPEALLLQALPSSANLT